MILGQIIPKHCIYEIFFRKLIFTLLLTTLWLANNIILFNVVAVLDS